MQSEDSKKQASEIKFKGEAKVERSDTFKKLSAQADTHKYPLMDPNFQIPWQQFTVPDFKGKDGAIDDYDIQQVLLKRKDELVDFRPYMNDNPMTVVSTDSIAKCLTLFRNMHLRHLCVIHPIYGTLVGIITRQDLFTWLDM